MFLGPLNPTLQLVYNAIPMFVKYNTPLCGYAIGFRRSPMLSYLQSTQHCVRSNSGRHTFTKTKNIKKCTNQNYIYKIELST